MARKRKNGEGSWGKKNFKGVPYFYYRDSNGNYTYAKSEKEVKEKLKKKEEQEHLIKSSNKLTLGEYITSWLYNKKFKESGLTLESTTFDGYEAALQKRFYDYPISNMQVSALWPFWF